MSAAQLYMLFVCGRMQLSIPNHLNVVTVLNELTVTLIDIHLFMKLKFFLNIISFTRSIHVCTFLNSVAIFTVITIFIAILPRSYFEVNYTFLCIQTNYFL